MPDPVAKIGSIDTAKLTPSDPDKPVELRIPFTVEVDGQTYIHTVAVVSEPLTRFHGIVTAADIEAVIKQQADRIANIHALAAELQDRVGVDVVAEAKAIAADPAPTAQPLTP